MKKLANSICAGCLMMLFVGPVLACDKNLDYDCLNSKKIGAAEAHRLAREYLDLSNTQTVFEESLERKAVELSLRSGAGSKGDVRAMIDQYIGWSLIEEQVIAAVLKSYAVSELEVINGFLSTESGQRFIEESSVISATLSLELNKLISDAMLLTPNELPYKRDHPDPRSSYEIW